jgi:hypothetical protein
MDCEDVRYVEISCCEEQMMDLRTRSVVDIFISWSGKTHLRLGFMVEIWKSQRGLSLMSVNTHDT